MAIKLLKKQQYYNQYGTRKHYVEFEGEATQEELEDLVHDAPYGCWWKYKLVDEDRKLYKGELHEYWD